MPEQPPQQKFSSPEEEIAYLRAQIAKGEQVAASQEAPVSYEVVAKKELGAYSRFTPKAVLSEKYQLGDAQVATIAERTEASADKAGEVLNVARTEGVRNALTVLEKLGSAYLTDEVHRRLVEEIRGGAEPPNLKEESPLWNVFHMTLFSVTLPEVQGEEGREQALATLINAMEQFYAGMQSISPRRGTPRHFTLEIAVSEGSDDIVFYVAVPTAHIDLFEKQLLSLFPTAVITEERRDYNIFVEGGTAIVGTAKLKRHAIYPLRDYEDFERDPLHVLLNAFSKIDRDGSGAALQLVLRPQSDSYGEYRQILDRVRKGMPAKKSIELASIKGQIFDAFRELVSSSEKKEDDPLRPQETDEAAIEQFERKVSAPLIATNMRIAVSAHDATRARQIFNDIEASFNQFENTSGNRIEFEVRAGSTLRRELRAFSFREYLPEDELPLSIAELAGIVHFPVQDVQFSPQIKQSRARSVAAPINLPREGTLLGTNSYRSMETPVYITPEDRLRHFYIIGQTGTGKTTLMKNMIVQDIAAGNGVCMIDPHGTDIVDVLAAVPASREGDIIYFDPANTERSIGLNMLEYDPAHPEQKTFVVNEMLSIFTKLFDMKTAGGPMFEQYFRNATLLVLEDPASGSTLMDISRVLADADYRALKLSRAKNPTVVQFWTEIAGKAGGEASLENIVPYITSKFDIFTANDYMRPIIGQQQSAFNFRQIMDERKILLVNLSKGRLGEINANLIGMIIVGKILMAALSRVDDTSRTLPPFYLHMDEFQNVTTDSITAILSEARKYKLGLTVAHQYIAQLEESIRDAVFGNVGSMAVFRVGPEDAEFLEKQFAPTFAAHDLMNIENRNAYVRVLADGAPAKPFNIKTVPPPPVDHAAVATRIALLLARHGRLREEVEAEILARYQR